MRIIARRTLKAFWQRPGRRDAEQPLRAWYAAVKAAKWSGPADIKVEYRSVSILKASRAVFNISGNKNRLVVHVRYDLQRVYVRFVSSHAEYDRIDAGTI